MSAIRTPRSDAAEPIEGPAWSARDLAADPHRAEDKPERVRKMFAAIARRYDLNNTLHSFGRDAAWRRRAVKLAGLRGGERVLDCACGTGELSREFARATPTPRYVVASDYTDEMLDVARHKPALPAGSAPVRYEHADATALPYEDASFDVVSIAFGIRNVSDPAKAAREFRRVLAPAGRLIILEFSQPRSRILGALNAFYTCRIMPRTASLIARDRSGAYSYLPRSVATFLGPAQMEEMLKNAGFSSVSRTPLTFGVCTAYRGETSV
ncbi:MAG: ubiquinone/menaquinone biosynthesis methyltransferase [Phycisphaerales bacterium]